MSRSALVVLTLLLAGAASASAQAPAHAVPFGAEGNAIELEVAGLDGRPAEVVVTSAPGWASFAAPTVAVGTGDGGPVAHLAFDVSRAAPVGAPGTVAVEVRSGDVLVAEHTVRLVVSAPAELALGAPYPNPSRGAVTVPYEVPAAGRVRVSVVDVLGREVAVLVDGERPAGGAEAVFEAGALASGVYLVRLASGGQARVRRVTVAR